MESQHWARGLAEELLAEPLPRRWAHVLAVEARAVEVGPALGEDGELLQLAAVLHDVGYAPSVAATTFHPLDGARYLRDLRVASRVCALVAHHSAAADEAAVLGLADELAEFEDERTPVRDALWFCDMTTGPDGQRLTLDERMTEVRERYGPDHYVTRALDVSMPERAAAVERTQALMRRAGLGQV